ncbi:hypothetical protein QTJ16_002864 [Diplocarpon rosae]|uniref:Uncharacterized protein n=1 Tax=Diplocarpon rosae TaxID=946125 RepID=A0AAD9WFF6_9HELO|nr:hypothetical protein QTJ16_002864 [Diplocarpon rosae]
MHFSSVATASLLALLSTASARITGLSAPSTIAAGRYFTISLLTDSANHSVYDVAAAIGVAPGAGAPGSLGTPLGTYFVGPSLSNTLAPLPFTMSMAPNITLGPVTLTATVFSLHGAAASPQLDTFTLQVTVGNSTSVDLVQSVNVK